jgi:hypothetical protein
MRQLLAGLSEMELVMGRAWRPNRPLSRHRLKFVPFRPRGPWLQEKAHNSASLSFMIFGPQHWAQSLGYVPIGRWPVRPVPGNLVKARNPGLFRTSASPVGLNMTVPIFARNHHRVRDSRCLPLVTIDFRLVVTGIRRPAVLRLSRQ